MNNNLTKDFIWGAATASYQIEGAWNEDGRGESIWDQFSHTSGNVQNGDTGDRACDHYHRWRDDIGLMKEIGLNAYRFSVGWPRILPEGRGRVNQAGLEFYDQLVDGLLEADIIPYVTLYHWDLPQALEEKGGWPSRMIVDAYVKYADIISRKLGDRIKNWITLNEPWVSAFLGYELGIHAPGRKDMRKALAASHHLLLSHGQAVPVIRANSPGARVGITLDLNQQDPASSSLHDRKAATWADGYKNRWFLDPIVGRGYPQDMLASYGNAIDFIQPGDMDVIAVPTDFLGVNYYTRNIIRSSEISEEENEPRTVSRVGTITEMDWEVYPKGLYNLLGRLHFAYNFPAIYITENGAAFPDKVNDDGSIDDNDRLEYIKSHLQIVRDVSQIGVPVKGYFAWSLMDNFEWGYGYSKRFGIVRVDYETQERTMKSSAKWYNRAIQANNPDVE